MTAGIRFLGAADAGNRQAAELLQVVFAGLRQRAMANLSAEVSGHSRRQAATLVGREREERGGRLGDPLIGQL